MEKEELIRMIKMIRRLVSDVQGAPFPGDGLDPEVYSIWYEHVQKNAQVCYEFLDSKFPLNPIDLDKMLDKFFK